MQRLPTTADYDVARQRSLYTHRSHRELTVLMTATLTQLASLSTDRASFVDKLTARVPACVRQIG